MRVSICLPACLLAVLTGGDSGVVGRGVVLVFISFDKRVSNHLPFCTTRQSFHCCCYQTFGFSFI